MNPEAAERNRVAMDAFVTATLRFARDYQAALVAAVSSPASQAALRRMGEVMREGMERAEARRRVVGPRMREGT